jgi:hypothetical protein
MGNGKKKEMCDIFLPWGKLQGARRSPEKNFGVRIPGILFFQTV